MKILKITLQSNIFFVFIFISVFFYCLFFTRIIKYETNMENDTKEIIAKILSYTIDGDKLSLILKNKEKIKATYYIQSKEEKNYLENSLKIGLTIKILGSKSDIVDSTIPNTFNYKKYLYNQKIYFSFNVTKIELLNEKIEFLANLKNLINNRIKKLGNNSYLKAFIIGDKTLIDNEQYESITKNGVSHLFALSGMHLSLVYLFLAKILNKLKFKKIIIYTILFLYLAVTGFSVSFIRAILFMLLLDLDKNFNINLSKLKILFLTAFIIIFINPFYIYNAGFWYTFVVTFSLIFCSDFINKQSKLKQIFLVSIITFLFSMPISIYLNYEINLFSIINNIILVPFISTLVFPLALLTFVFPICLSLFNMMITILETLNNIFKGFALNLIVGKINLIEVIILYFTLILSFKTRLKKLFIIYFGFLTILYNKNIFNLNYNVYFIDVGQGDSALFIAPQNKEVIMIDTGGSISYRKEEYQIRNKEFKLSDNIIMFLKSMRIRKIDLLIITHGDKDHLGYAIDLGKEIKFKNVMINQGKINKLESDLLRQNKQVKNYKTKKFDLNFLSLNLYDNENDNSIITKIKIYNNTFLLMGDASSKVEDEIIKKYNFKITFLKIGHHGSKTSSSLAFLKKFKPKYAIISAGRNNRYNHPSIETINALNKLNIDILNTIDRGTIKIIINKKRYNIISSIS